MKFHQIQGIDVCTSCWRPDEAHARLVAAPCIASTAPAVSQTNDTHTAGSHTSNRRSARKRSQAQPHGWICGRTTLQTSRWRWLLGASATPRYHTTAAESQKPCQSQVYGSAEPWQRAATRAPEHDTHESISNSCQHACRHRRCALLGLLTSWAMESHASTLASTTSVVLHRVQ